MIIFWYSKDRWMQTIRPLYEYINKNTKSVTDFIKELESVDEDRSVYR